MRALGDRFQRALDVLAMHADQERAALVHVQLLAVPVQHRAVAARRRGGAHGLEIVAHDEDAMAGGAQGLHRFT